MCGTPQAIRTATRRITSVRVCALPIESPTIARLTWRRPICAKVEQSAASQKTLTWTTPTCEFSSDHKTRARRPWNPKKHRRKYVLIEVLIASHIKIFFLLVRPTPSRQSPKQARHKNTRKRNPRRNLNRTNQLATAVKVRCSTSAKESVSVDSSRCSATTSIRTHSVQMREAVACPQAARAIRKSLQLHSV